MLGDGVHLHFRDPEDAVRASLEIVEGVRPRGLPPAHIGVNAGPMIYDEGDYFGRTVNIAARIASQAGADKVFVGEDAWREVMPAGFRFVEIGRVDLKGILSPVKVYEAVRTLRESLISDVRTALQQSLLLRTRRLELAADDSRRDLTRALGRGWLVDQPGLGALPC